MSIPHANPGEVLGSDHERSRWFPYLVWVGIATVLQLSITWSNW